MPGEGAVGGVDDRGHEHEEQRQPERVGPAPEEEQDDHRRERPAPAPCRRGRTSPGTAGAASVAGLAGLVATRPLRFLDFRLSASAWSVIPPRPLIAGGELADQSAGIRPGRRGPSSSRSGHPSAAWSGRIARPPALEQPGNRAPRARAGRPWRAPRRTGPRVVAVDLGAGPAHVDDDDDAPDDRDDVDRRCPTGPGGSRRTAQPVRSPGPRVPGPAAQPQDQQREASPSGTRGWPRRRRPSRGSR